MDERERRLPYQSTDLTWITSGTVRSRGGSPTFFSQDCNSALSFLSETISDRCTIPFSSNSTSKLWSPQRRPAPPPPFAPIPIIHMDEPYHRPQNSLG